MRKSGLAAIVLVVFAGGRAEAAVLDVHDLYRKAEAVVRSLFKPAPADHEMIKPPGNVDPQMALAPPAGGTMRLIEPTQPFRQR